MLHREVPPVVLHRSHHGGGLCEDERSRQKGDITVNLTRNVHLTAQHVQRAPQHRAVGHAHRTTRDDERARGVLHRPLAAENDLRAVDVTAGTQQEQGQEQHRYQIQAHPRPPLGAVV